MNDTLVMQYFSFRIRVKRFDKIDTIHIIIRSYKSTYEYDAYQNCKKEYFLEYLHFSCSPFLPGSLTVSCKIEKEASHLFLVAPFHDSIWLKALKSLL
jgi:hypothetical protein